MIGSIFKRSIKKPSFRRRPESRQGGIQSSNFSKYTVKASRQAIDYNKNKQLALLVLFYLIMKPVWIPASAGMTKSIDFLIKINLCEVLHINKRLISTVFLLPVFLMGIASMPLHTAAEEDFGRLFSSSAERKKLDILRKNQKLIVVSPQKNTPLESATEELPEPITLQGYVKRSDGSTTLWINNKVVHENSIQDDVEIGRLNKQKNSAKNGSDSLNVRIPATGKNVRLKPGQVYEPETNQIIELRLLEKEKQLSLEEVGVIGGGTVD
jgi:hypothetical protein